MINQTATSFRDKSLLGKLRQIAQNPKKAVSKAAYYALLPVGTGNFRPFVVVTRDRTGSNMLMQALDSHPQLAAEYEIFGRLEGRREEDVLHRAYARQPFYIRAKGFKIFYYHPQDKTNSKVWELLASIDSLHVIHLRRRNILHALVSSRVAYKSGIYGLRSDRDAAKYGGELPTISFTPEGLERDFQQTRMWEQGAVNRFENRPILDVTYEAMTADLPGQFERITDFLGVARRQPQTDFKKQRTRPLSETIENYVALKMHFAGTSWEEFFDG
ncbi:MAG: sulfotransferase [Pseudomonadota bacterium]